MSYEVWAAFCVTETILCLTPGPAVLFVVSAALGRGARAGLAGALGILAGNILYFTLSATGIAAAIVASSALFTIIRIAGAAYLMMLGLRAVLSRRVEPFAPEARVVSRSFARGFVVQAANPKALIFFVALLPQFIDPQGSVVRQILILGVSSVLIELVVLTGYVFTIARARRLAGDRLAGALQRVGGGLLFAAGARLAVVGAR